MSIEDLPDELLLEIFERVPRAHEMYNISKRFYNIVEDIKQRVREDPEKYIDELSDPVSFLLYDPKYYDAIWKKAIDKGNLYLIVELDKLGYKFDADADLLKSTEKGYKDLVEFFILKGAKNMLQPLRIAAEKGYKDLVEVFIEKGFSNMKVAMRQGMRFAARGGHKDLIEFFISRGADNVDEGLEFAAREGNKDLINFFIEQGATNMNLGMAAAADGGYKNLVDFFIERGANNWVWGLQAAVMGGHEELVDFFRAKGVDDWWAQTY